MSDTVFICICVFFVVAQTANIAWFVFMKQRIDAVRKFHEKAIDYFYNKGDFSGYDAMPSCDEMLWQLRKWDWSEYLK